MSSDSAVSTALRNIHQISGIAWSPVGRPVLAVTTRAKRAGCSATSRSPISPPQSWPTRVTSRRSRWSNASARTHRHSTCRANEWSSVCSGLSERPNPTRSGAIARMPSAHEHVDHVAVEVGPGRLAVQEQHHRPVGRTCIHVGHPQGATVAVRHLGVRRLPGEAGQASEAFVRGAVGLHPGSLADSPARMAPLERSPRLPCVPDYRGGQEPSASSRERSRAASIAARNAARTLWISSSRRAEAVVPPGEVTCSRSTVG